jgi:NAD(P)-dependent dehydrogenase (short-subunit alcohol dehydrogenase family)
MTAHAVGARMLTGKAIFISGAGRGIGAAAARLFAEEGASVMLMSRTEDELGVLTEEIRGDGGIAAYTVGRVEDADAISAALASMTSLFGKVDGAFNNAGFRPNPAKLIDVDERDFDAAWSVNLRSVWVAMKLEIRAIREASGVGAIVNTSSAVGFFGSPGGSAYASSKRGLNSLTATAALELAAEGIRVNAIAPGVTLTSKAIDAKERDPKGFARIVERTPLGRVADPREIGQAAAWLLSDRASFVTGIVLPVDGGAQA